MDISNLINQQAANNADKIAVKQGTDKLTYAQLAQQAAQLACYLQNLGMQPGDVAALAVDRNPQMIVCFAALVNAGITYLPVDNNFPEARIKYMLEDAGAKMLITTHRHAEKYAGEHNVVYLEDALKASEIYVGQKPAAKVDPDGVMYILYTSGSTGKPKGVQVKYKGLVNLLQFMLKEPGITPDDLYFFTSTVSFDIAEEEIFLPLIAGATILVADAETARDGRALLDVARTEGVTIMQGTPFFFKMLLEAGWTERLLIKVFCGGEAMTKEFANAVVPRCKELWNLYGPTETTVYSLVKHIKGDEKMITIGKPVANTPVYILDLQLNQLPAGEVGEIYIGGEGVAKGYLNRPELTAERFIDDPFDTTPGAKMYKTGDLGLLIENGDIQCLGRADEQIKIKGYRIETGEIESLLKQLPAVADAIIAPYTDPAGNPHLVGYIVYKTKSEYDGPILEVPEMQEYLAASLPVYMIPGIFVAIDAVPILPNGKTDRKSLPAPVISNDILEDYVAPETATEHALTEIFLNNMAIERLGVNDNFFRMGINSLIMVKVMVQIEKQYGKRYPLSALIKYPSIKEFARMMDDSITDSQYRSLVPIKPNGSKMPLYIVHGIGLNLMNMYHMISLMDEDQPVYGLQAVGLDGGDLSPLESIESIARFYISEILAHDPIGPYAVSGYSFGGFIAYEMVRQLKEMGKEVKMLAMFDTNLQVSSANMSFSQKLGLKGVRQIKKLLFRLQKTVQAPVKNLKYLIKQAPDYFYDSLKLAGIDIKPKPNDIPDYMLDIMKHLRRIFTHYKLQPLDIKIDMFKADDIMFFVDDPKKFGWSKLAKRGVEVHVVPGDHHHMFEPPNDTVLAKKLQEQLDLLA